MKGVGPSTTPAATLFPGSDPVRFTKPILWRIELAVFAVLLALLNLPLLAGQLGTTFIYLPEAVRAGEWWRVLTHAFVHVSPYHLLLDATAFFLLYTDLRDHRRFERFAFLLAAGAGSLLVSLWAAPAMQTRGLCGLSGIAHGLAAISALEMMAGATSRKLWHLGLASLVFVLGKSAMEAVTGKVAFASLHLGWLGFPVAVCHAGGVLGALAVWLWLRGRFFTAPADGRRAGPPVSESIATTRPH